MLSTMNDSEIQQDVLREIQWEASINTAHIGVSIRGGVVTLTAHVSSYVEIMLRKKRPPSVVRSTVTSSGGMPNEPPDVWLASAL